MTNKNISLAYCKENANIAKKITQSLAVTDYEIEKYLGEDFHQDDSNTHLLVEFDQAVLLIISDNFLKSTDCMYGALKMLQQLSSRRQVLPIITDGRTWDEKTQSFQYQPTSFEKVSNVIQYMNFWQDRYLEMRRKKRHIQAEEELAFNKILKKTRSISSEVGEFLRHLRNLNFVSYQELENKQFDPFFKFMNSPKKLSDYSPHTHEQAETEETVLNTVSNERLSSNAPNNIIAAFQNGVTQNSTLVTEEEAIEEALQEVHQLNIQSENTPIEFLDEIESLTEPLDPPTTQEHIEPTLTEGMSAWEQIEQLAASSEEEESEETQTETTTTPTAADDVILLENIIQDDPNSLDKDVTTKTETQTEDLSVEESLQALENIFGEEITAPSTHSSMDSGTILEDVLGSEPQSEQKNNTKNPEEEDNFIESLLTWIDKDETSTSDSIEEDTVAEEATTPSHGVVIEDEADGDTIAEVVAAIVETQETVETEIAEISTQTPSSVELSPEAVDISAIINGTMAMPDLASPFLEKIERIKVEEEVIQEAIEVVNTEEDLDISNIVNSMMAAPDLSSAFLSTIKKEEAIEENIAEPVAVVHHDAVLSETEDLSDLTNNSLVAPDLSNALLNSNTTETPQSAEIVANKTTENNILKTSTEQTMLDSTNVQLAPSELDDLFQQGVAAEENKDYKLAKKQFKAVAKIDPNYPAIYEKLGFLSLYHFVDAKKASKYFKKALKANPTNAEIQYQYANLLYEYAEKPHKAATHFKNTLQIQPKHPFANYDLALIYYQMGDKFKAHRAYHKAVEVNPQLKTEQNDLAFAYIPTAEEEAEATKFEVLQKDIQNLEQLLVAKQKQEAIDAPKPGNDKTVFITGATSGIGRATAELFAQHGYRLILTGRRKERLKVIKGFFEKNYNSDIQTLPFDVRDLDAVKEALEGLKDEWKQIDILINNAGLAKGISPIHEGDIEEWDTMIDTNIKGLLYMTRAIAPHMVRRNHGHIINVCSTSGKEVYAGGNVYCATKFAVDALTKAMRIDLYKYKIRVSQVSPAHVEETEFSAVRFNGDTKKANKVYEDFRPLTSRDVADAIYYMASRPPHVNILDVTLQGRQQASANHLDRSGR